MNVFCYLKVKMPVTQGSKSNSSTLQLEILIKKWNKHKKIEMVIFLTFVILKQRDFLEG